MVTPGSKRVTLVLGGVRSGKSRYAQQLAEHAVGTVVFVATATAFDDEMRLKIDRHRATRPAGWTTIEEPLKLADVLDRTDRQADSRGSAASSSDHTTSVLVLIDCLTIFTANLLHDVGENEAEVRERTIQLCSAIKRCPCDVVLVSNEVGSGVVPAYALGRQFRDALGELNQSVAKVADDVVLLVAGLPLALKGDVRRLG